MLCTWQCFPMLTADNICNQPNWMTQEWVWPHSAENPRSRASCWLGAEGVTQPCCGLSPSHTKTVYRKLAPVQQLYQTERRAVLVTVWEYQQSQCIPALLQLQCHGYRNVGPVALPGGHFLYRSSKSRWKPNGEKGNPLHCAREMPRHNEMTLIQGRDRRQI